MAEVDAGRTGFSGWQWRCLLAFSIVICLFCMMASLSHIARASGLLNDWIIEPYLVLETPDGTPAGWQLVVEAPADGAAGRAGIRVGDLIRSDLLGVTVPAIAAPGVRVPVTVERDGRRFRTDIVAPEQAPIQLGGGTFILASQGLAGIAWASLGLLLLLRRGRRDRAAAMVGMLMQCLAWTAGGFGFLWAPATVVLQLQVILGIAAAAGICLFLPLTGLALAGSSPNLRERRLVRNLSAVLAAAAIAFQFVRLFDQGLGNILFVGSIFLSALLCFGCIARHYRHNDAPARNRIKIVLLAFAAYLVSFALFFLFIASGQSLDLLWAIIASGLTGLAGPSLMAYAILKQRLFDLGFAINRTLVYGAAAFTLLVTFGLLEYGAKSLIPTAWPDAGPFISAGIAVLLFLSFHRLHHWFEHHIERFFFRKWQEAEAELRRFVHSAGHTNNSDALCKTTVEALSRYAEGTEAVLYLRRADGTYRREAGRLAGAKAGYPDADPAFAMMRSERKPLELAGAPGSLPGELALPMLEQGVLTGFVLLGPKPDGTHYRPDEKQLLDWAVHHVGLDLRALHARQLEAQVVLLGEKLAWAEKQLARQT